MLFFLPAILTRPCFIRVSTTLSHLTERISSISERVTGWLYAITDRVSSAALLSLTFCIDTEFENASIVSARSGDVAICQPPARYNIVSPCDLAYVSFRVLTASSTLI